MLASILSKSVIDPFDSQETQVYKDDKEVAAMAQLRAAYQVNDIKTFESILKDKRNHIADDHIIAYECGSRCVALDAAGPHPPCLCGRPVVSDLLRGVRSRVITRIVRPYRAIRLEFLAKVWRCVRWEVALCAVLTRARRSWMWGSTWWSLCWWSSSLMAS